MGGCKMSATSDRIWLSAHFEAASFDELDSEESSTVDNYEAFARTARLCHRDWLRMQLEVGCNFVGRCSKQNTMPKMVQRILDELDQEREATCQTLLKQEVQF